MKNSRVFESWAMTVMGVGRWNHSDSGSLVLWSRGGGGETFWEGGGGELIDWGKNFLSPGHKFLVKERDVWCHRCDKLVWQGTSQQREWGICHCQKLEFTNISYMMITHLLPCWLELLAAVLVRNYRLPGVTVSKKGLSLLLIFIIIILSPTNQFYINRLIIIVFTEFLLK